MTLNASNSSNLEQLALNGVDETIKFKQKPPSKFREKQSQSL